MLRFKWASSKDEVFLVHKTNLFMLLRTVDLALPLVTSTMSSCGRVNVITSHHVNLAPS